MRTHGRGRRVWTPTGRILVDLLLWMCMLGVAIGLVFPPFAVALGVEPGTAFTPRFFLACIGAGLTLGFLSGTIAKKVIGVELSLLSDKMSAVRDKLLATVRTGEMDGCDPEECRVDIQSEDEIGRCADAFNALVDALATSTMLRAEIAEVTDAMARHLNLNDLARAALDHLAPRGPFDAGAVVVLHHDEVRLLASAGIGGPERIVDLELVRAAAERGEAKRIDVPDDVVIHAGLVDFRPATLLVLPLVVSSVPFGALVVAGVRTPTEPELRLTEATAANLALGLQNALAHDELERLAALDGLTGAYNRRFGSERLYEEMLRAVRAGTPIAVAMIDIDHFKSVNDTYGHIVGDRVLRQMASAIQQNLRTGDSLVRFGGEEFLAILPGAASRDAAAVAERIRRRCSDLVVDANGSKVHVTVSVGVASHPEGRVESLEQFVQAADDALYEAKRTGRNVVVVADQGAHARANRHDDVRAPAATP